MLRSRSRPFWLEPEPKKLRSFGSGSIIKKDEWNQNSNFLKFVIIIVEIIFGVKKIKMFILVDPSRGLVRVYCLYVCMFVLLRIHSFLPYNSPGAGAGAVLFLKGRSRSRSRRKSGGSETLDFYAFLSIRENYPSGTWVNSYIPWLVSCPSVPGYNLTSAHSTHLMTTPEHYWAEFHKNKKSGLFLGHDD